MIFYLKEDILSYSKKVYAVKGSKVKLISDHDNCIVAESLDTKERFGVNKNKLSIEFIEKIKIKEIKKQNK